LSLTGIVEDEVDSEAAFWGKESQPAILRRYNKETGRNMVMCDIIYQHPKYEFITFTPDALEVSGFEWPKSSHIVELKQTSIRDQYGEPGTDQVSDETALQCQLYMGCCEAKTCDVAVHFLRPRHEFAIFPLRFNQELFDNIIEKARDFWNENVLKNIPPPIDASEGSKRLLNHLYPRDVEDLFAATAEVEEEAEWIKTFEKQRDDAVAALTYHQNKMKDFIGHHQGVITSLGRVMWKKNRDSEVVDWKAVAEDMQFFLPSDKKLEDFIETRTTIKPGSRVFRPFWKKEE
jgi:predicted phage-related endonuclease